MAITLITSQDVHDFHPLLSHLPNVLSHQPTRLPRNYRFGIADAAGATAGRIVYRSGGRLDGFSVVQLHSRGGEHYAAQR